MKTIYEFKFNYKFYRSTDRDILQAFADIFGMTVEIKKVGLSSEAIELERV